MEKVKIRERGCGVGWAGTEAAENHTHIHTYFRVAVKKTRKPPEKDGRPDGRHPRHAHRHTFSHLQGPEKLVRTYANKCKNGKSMMMKLEDIREVPAVGPSHRRGSTKCTVKIR